MFSLEYVSVRGDGTLGPHLFHEVYFAPFSSDTSIPLFPSCSLASMASWDYIDTFFADAFDSTATRQNYSEPAAATVQPLPPTSSAPLSPPSEPYLSTEGPLVVPEAPRDLPQPMPLPQAQQQAPPSPPKPMFDFVSPFDALASAATSKKKQVLIVGASSSSGNEDSWTSASLGSLANDPKRKSVENLIDQLTRSQAPYGPGRSSPSPTYDPYNTADEYSQVESNQPAPQQQQQQQPRTMPPPPPLPPKPDRASPPKALVQQQQHRSQGRSAESPVGHPIPPARKEKDGSPGPRPWKSDGRGKGGVKGKSQPSPAYVFFRLHYGFCIANFIICSTQPQIIVFDVSQPLDEVQAPRDTVKSTAIALVKQDSVFLPGTTIGATHWIAYAMTRGRVRVISRSSGDRTLLQLPTVFAPSTQVVDMAVYGNRLAGVTSDGGFVVWELPEVITDDVP